jgi:hypothetical protein
MLADSLGARGVKVIIEEYHTILINNDKVCGLEMLCCDIRFGET